MYSELSISSSLTLATSIESSAVETTDIASTSSSLPAMSAEAIEPLASISLSNTSVITSPSGVTNSVASSLSGLNPKPKLSWSVITLNPLPRPYLSSMYR